MAAGGWRVLQANSHGLTMYVPPSGSFIAALAQYCAIFNSWLEKKYVREGEWPWKWRWKATASS